MQVENIKKYIEGILDSIPEDSKITRTVFNKISIMLDKVHEEKEQGQWRPAVVPRKQETTTPPPQIVEEKKPKPFQWSSLHDKCIDCGKTDRKYLGRGYCSRCYFKHPTVEQKQKIMDTIQPKIPTANMATPIPAPNRTFTPTPGGADETMRKAKERDDAHIANVAFSYCANPTCHKGQFGKFVAGTGVVRQKMDFCSLNCADEFRPEVKVVPLPENTDGEIANKTRNL